MTELTDFSKDVYCPEKVGMFKCNGKLEKLTPIACLQTFHISNCENADNCDKEGKLDCLVGHSLQGRWDKP